MKAKAKERLTVAALATTALISASYLSATDMQPRTGSQAFGSWRDDAPGVSRRFSPNDLKAPKKGTDIEKPDNNYHAKLSQRTDAMTPKVPAGFKAELFAKDFKQPRVLRVAPNGDLFMAETGTGRILVFKAGADGRVSAQAQVFATGLTKPFGITFYPAGDAPKWVYVGQPDKVVRYPYKNGDLKASSAPEVILDGIPSEHHWTRDLAVAPDGKLLVSVGSGSNEGDGLAKKTPAEVQQFEATHGLGAAWDKEDGRAAVWSFDADGKNKHAVAHGLRNCVGLAVHDGDTWCVVNERDGLGDDVPFEYATTVKQDAFYGWPWYYIGDHEDPRRPGERPDLKGKVTVPDVLMQPHSAPLSIAFYDGKQFPPEYQGNAFVTFHGSWNRENRTGYKVVRLVTKDGKPTGDVVDFMTGFVVDDSTVWGRPVGVAVTRDGALMVSEDGSGTIWRVSLSAAGS